MKNTKKRMTKKNEGGEFFFILMRNLPRFLYLLIRAYSAFTFRKHSYMRKFRKTVLSSQIERKYALRIVEIQRKNMKFGLMSLLRALRD